MGSVCRRRLCGTKSLCNHVIFRALNTFRQKTIFRLRSHIFGGPSTIEIRLHAQFVTM